MIPILSRIHVNWEQQWNPAYFQDQEQRDGTESS